MYDYLFTKTDPYDCGRKPLEHAQKPIRRALQQLHSSSSEASQKLHRSFTEAPQNFQTTATESHPSRPQYIEPRFYVNMNHSELQLCKDDLAGPARFADDLI